MNAPVADHDVIRDLLHARGERSQDELIAATGWTGLRVHDALYALTRTREVAWRRARRPGDRKLKVLYSLAGADR
jgi:transcription initiation factor IIE alpha subunit